MARIENSEITQKAIKDLRLNAALEKMPTQSSDKIVLTYNLNERKNIQCASATRNVTGAGGVHTASTIKDTYLTSAYLGCMVNATNDGTLFELEITQADGSTRDLLNIRIIATTAVNKDVSVSFPEPIKIERGSVIVIRQTFTAGSSIVYGGVTYFEQES